MTADVTLSTGALATGVALVVTGFAAWKLRRPLWQEGVVDTIADLRTMVREVRQRRANQRTWQRAKHTRSHVTKIVRADAAVPARGGDSAPSPASARTPLAEMAGGDEYDVAPDRFERFQRQCRSWSLHPSQERRPS